MPRCRQLLKLNILLFVYEIHGEEVGARKLPDTITTFYQYNSFVSINTAVHDTVKWHKFACVILVKLTQMIH